MIGTKSDHRNAPKNPTSGQKGPTRPSESSKKWWTGVRKPKIFLRGISTKMTQTALRSFFQAEYPSEPLEVEMKERDRFDGKIAGCAFLTVTHEKTYNTILRKKHYTLFGREFYAVPCLEGEDLVRFRKELLRRRVFVVGLPPDFNNQKLKICLEERFGGVEDAFVSGFSKNVKKKVKYGYAVFQNFSTAEEAIKVNTLVIRDYRVKIKPYNRAGDESGRNGRAVGPKNSNSKNSMKVKNKGKNRARNGVGGVEMEDGMAGSQKQSKKSRNKTKATKSKTSQKDDFSDDRWAGRSFLDSKKEARPRDLVGNGDNRADGPWSKEAALRPQNQKNWIDRRFQDPRGPHGNQTAPGERFRDEHPPQKSKNVKKVNFGVLAKNPHQTGFREHNKAPSLQDRKRIHPFNHLDDFEPEKVQKMQQRGLGQNRTNFARRGDRDDFKYHSKGHEYHQTQFGADWRPQNQKNQKRGKRPNFQNLDNFYPENHHSHHFWNESTRRGSQAPRNGYSGWQGPYDRDAEYEDEEWISRDYDDNRGHRYAKDGQRSAQSRQYYHYREYSFENYCQHQDHFEEDLGAFEDPQRHTDLEYESRGYQPSQNYPKNEFYAQNENPKKSQKMSKNHQKRLPERQGNHYRASESYQRTNQASKQPQRVPEPGYPKRQIRPFQDQRKPFQEHLVKPFTTQNHNNHKENHKNSKNGKNFQSGGGEFFSRLLHYQRLFDQQQHQDSLSSIKNKHQKLKEQQKWYQKQEQHSKQFLNSQPINQAPEASVGAAHQQNGARMIESEQHLSLLKIRLKRQREPLDFSFSPVYKIGLQEVILTSDMLHHEATNLRHNWLGSKQQVPAKSF